MERQKTGPGQQDIRAEIFATPGGQTVRLPEGFQFEGETVRVSRQGKGVLLEPLTKKRFWTIEETRAWFAAMDAVGADPLFPEGRAQGVAEVRKSFD